jgi:transposase InsO family protein
MFGIGAEAESLTARLCPTAPLRRLETGARLDVWQGCSRRKSVMLSHWHSTAPDAGGPVEEASSALHVIDEHTREALAIRVARSIDADYAVGLLDTIVAERGSGREFVRMDNGPEMTANALHDWCRLGGSGRTVRLSRDLP